MRRTSGVKLPGRFSRAKISAKNFIKRHPKALAGAAGTAALLGGGAAFLNSKRGQKVFGKEVPTDLWTKVYETVSYPFKYVYKKVKGAKDYFFEKKNEAPVAQA